MYFSQFKRWIPLILVSFLFIQGVAAILAADNPEQTETKIVVANDKSNQTIPFQMDENSTHNQIGEQVKNSPLMFIENVGQFDERIQFQVRGQQGTFYFTNNAVWLTVLEPAAELSSDCFSGGPHFPPAVLANMGKESCVHSREAFQPRGVNLKLSFANANPDPRIVGFDPLDTAVSYFIGNDPNNWHTNVPVYAGVRYEDVYPGVDIEYVGLNGHWQTQLVAKPWADLSAVEWQVEGANLPTRQFADALTLADDGRLHIETAVGAIELPLLLIDKTKTPIQPKPSLHGNQIRQPFTTARQNQQVVTGSVPYRTYLGGSADDIGLGIAVDDSGAAYVVGVTWSADFHPVITNTLQGSTDIFIAKINPTGDGLVYAAYLGGSGHECDTSYGECAAAIAVAGNGDVYLTGTTWSDDFPTPNGLYTDLGGDADAFVAQLNAAGNQLIYGAYLGGSQPSWSNTDYGRDIAVDSAGYIYVTGETWSSDFPQLNPVKNSPNDETDAFVTKLTPAGDALVYSTYLGGDTGVNDPWGAYDYGNGIAVDDAGAAYVTGWTASEDLLTGIPVSLQASLGGASGLDHCREEYWCPDAFVIKLGANGDAIYGTYLGASGWDEGRDIAVHNNEAYVTGIAGSCDWGGCDAPFITRLDANGGGPIYTTQINGSQEETGNAIAVDSAGAAYITGNTKSDDFPVTTDAFQSAPGNPGPYNQYDDAFVVKLDASGEQVYGTYLGGSDYDYGYGIAVNSGGVYVTGETWSTDFPTSTLALQTNHGGGLRDTFAARFDIAPAITETLILELLDADGNDVTGLTLNAEGWPISNTAHLDIVANPLTIKATLTNLEETETTLPFVLEITFPDTPGRFHIFDFTGSPADNAELCWDIPSDEYSDSSFTTNCVDPNIILQPGQSQTYQWQLRVQPSDAAQMQVRGTILVDGGEDAIATKSVDIPQAAIHPAVFVHGILGSMPPRNSVITQWPQNLMSPVASVSEGYLDPFLDSYTPIIENLLKMGYEIDKTLFPVTYDWRQSNRESAAYLHSVLQSSDYVQGSANVSYVVSEPDGTVKANVAVHSMGGLVTRAYIEDMAADSSVYEGDIHKLVFIATPHRGFPITYNTWEGLSWEDYLSTEVDGWSGGSTLPFLTDNLLWPYFVLKQYDPTPLEYCYSSPFDPGGPSIPSVIIQELYDALNSHYGDNWPGLITENFRLLTTGVTCPRTILYDYTHDSNPSRAIGSLPEMLPPVTDSYREAAVRAIPPYLLDTAGNEYPYPPPSPDGKQVNPLLETYGLNSPANVALLADYIGLENIYVVYGNGEDTVREYRVNEPPVIDPPWLHYWTWQWNTRWQNGEPDGLVKDTSGDNLIPTYSTRLYDDGEGLLPHLPGSNEREVIGPDDPNIHAGHKGLAYSSEAQKMVGWAFAGLPGGNDSFPFATDYVAPIIGLNNGDALLVFLVWSPVDVLVTDPVGRRIGYDPYNGAMVNEIPGAFYSGNGSDEEFFLLPAGVVGEYTVTTVGTGSGAYAVSVHRVSAAEMRTISVIGGEAQPGQIVSQTVSYDLALQSLFFDDMEDGTENWTISEGWTTITGTAHSPATSWQGIAISNGITLTLDVALDLSDTGYAQAHFWSRLLPGEAETAEALVEVSNDDGGTWQTVWRRQQEQLEWTPTELDLLPYIDEGQNSLQLRFRLFDETGTTVWQIDDVGVGYLPILPEQFSLPFVDSLDTLDKWTATGDWQPDTNTVHAGTQSWVASDDGASMTMARPLEIGDAANPTLAFWTRWTLPVTDAGYIEISPDNGQTWTAVYTQTVTTTAWTQVEIPLANYTGETILTRLRLVAPAPANAGEGWWVDDFLAFDKYVPIIHTLPFSDTFETGDNWQPWQGWTRTTNLAHTGEYAFFADTDRDSLQLVDKLDLTNTTTPVLTFWENFDAGEGQLLLSTDNGINWQPIYTRTVASVGWEQASVDLSPFVSEQVQLSFYLPDAEAEQAARIKKILLAKSSVPLGTSPAVPDSSPRWPWEAVLLLLPALAMAVPPVKRRIPKHYLFIGGIFLLLGACIFWYVIYPQTSWGIKARWRALERMTEVTGGQVDVVVPASTYISGGSLSPDGRWIYWGVAHNRADIPVSDQFYMLNLETGEQFEVPDVGYGSRWITDNYLASRGPQYRLLHVPDLSIRDLEMVTLEEANKLLRNADDVYIVKGFDDSGTGMGLLSLDPAFPYATRTHVERDEVTLNYTYIPGRLEGYEDGIVSPDGTLIAMRRPYPKDGFESYLEIQSSVGEIVATVHAKGRSPFILGWGADGRTIYFVERVGGSAGDIYYPERPIFKLTIDNPTSMTTPSKSRIASYRRAAQVNPSGWYIDDLLVEDRGAASTPGIGSYTVFGLNSIWLRKGNDLYSGNVGALDASEWPVLHRDSEVTIGRKVVFHDPASTIMGDSVTLKRKAVVNDVFYNEIDIANNAVYSAATTPLTVPLPITLPSFPEINPGTVDYTIARGDSLELPAGAYGSVTLRKNSILTLTGGIYQFENINIGRKSQLLVTAPTEIRIANRLEPGTRAVIGPAPDSGLNATDLVIFAGGINGNDGGLNSFPKTAVIGQNNILAATIYAPNGTLWIKKGTSATGSFIANDVRIGQNVQLWLESAFGEDY